MAVSEVVTGQQRGWSLLEKLGEGDAGEVYLVESPLDKTQAILKRPHRSAFSTDILRQASQIETEGKILRALAGVSINGQGLPAAGMTLSFTSPRLAAPGLLDQSPPVNSFGERYFIVIEKASGFDLGFLARAARFGLPASELSAFQGSERSFLAHLAAQGEIPDLILLRALSSALDLMEKIHSFRITIDGQERGGILWNDVKPEHIFWDPVGSRFTVIDWGNGQFLEADGTTKDRRNSRADDYAQFIQEMGKFLAMAGPDLHARLAWPEVEGPPAAYLEAVAEFKEKIRTLLQGEIDGLLALRAREAEIIGGEDPRPDGFGALEEVHTRLVNYGEFPEYAGAEHFTIKLGTRLASERKWADFRTLAQKAGEIPGANQEKWLLLGQIAGLAGGEGAYPALANGLLAGLNDDWAETLWSLLHLFRGGAEPPWWEDLCARVRGMQLGGASQTLTPYVTVNRLAHTLQAAYLKQCDALTSRGGASQGEIGEDEAAGDLKAFETLVKTLREEVVKRWRQVEPDPPDSGLEYLDLDRITEAVASRLPEARSQLTNALDQPKAQVKIILDAWGRKDFDTARRGLRMALLWDPDRRRVLGADEALLRAPNWLENTYLGPRRGDTIQDYLTHVELEGRELRNQVGPARWLDLILETLSRLRKGANPADLIFEHPELLTEMSWLNEYEQRRPAPVQRSSPVKLERDRGKGNTDPFLRGIQESDLGPEDGFSLGEPLDTWAPEARGSSARVFLGSLRGAGGAVRQAAVKIMRPDRADYALPLFREEVPILTMMRDVPGVNEMFECGFIRLEEGAHFPEDDRQASAGELRGSAVRFGVGDLREFLSGLDSRAGQGWLPYVAIERQPREASLVMLCDAGYTHGRFLPMQEALRVSIQILDVLQAAHLRNIVYRDHKILHYYWSAASNGVTVIDWNVAKRHPEGLSAAEKGFDLVQFGARALHHILTGRVAPGALPLGPTRPDEIEQASRTYNVQWTYDDQRLPTVLRDLVERTLSGSYSSAKDLREDLTQVFLQLPDTTL
jgi:serine/threonine protein kinase